MKPFHINISEEEYEAVLITLSSIRDPISLYSLHQCTGLNENRLRYMIDEMVAKGKVQKIVVDDRPHHKRYRYEIVRGVSNVEDNKTRRIT